MTTAIETHGGSALSVHAGQSYWTDQQLAALHQLGVQSNSQGDLAVFFHQAQATGLDPFKREIYMITRQGKATIQTGIDGFYKIADRVTRATHGTWGISETYWCGEDGVWRDVWLSRQAPAAAKVIVERNGSRFTTVALTAEYSAAGPMWKKMPARMVAKCAEALAIRKAFPEDLSGLYTSDEMAQADVQQVQHSTSSRRQTQQASSGRDWIAELQQCETGAQVRELGNQMHYAGELTDELRSQISETIQVLESSEAPQDAEIVNENGEVINA